MQATTVYIVYIHGFQGDQTSFQSFPTDLHNTLTGVNDKDGVGFLPTHITLKSIIYPTYKSRKSIHIATAKFLQWMYTLPPGLVILVAHSMGGLLAADAAYAAASERFQTRIIGILACDVPYLGMHPHVVLSGLASLLPKRNKKEEKTVKRNEEVSIPGTSLPSRNEKEMNDEQVVDCAPELPDSTNEDQTRPNLFNGNQSIDQKNLMSTSLAMSSFPSLVDLATQQQPGSLVPPPLPPRPLSCPPKTVSPVISPFPSPKELLYLPPPTHPYIHLRSKSERDVSSSSDESTTLLPHNALHLLHLDRITNSSTKSLFSNLSDRTKQQAVAYYDSIVETMEFGITMFDPKGLLARYKALIEWKGHWFVFWSVAIRHHEKTKKPHEIQNTDTTTSTDYYHRNNPSPHHAATESYHHFVVTPREKNKWERIVIHGAKDEVEAHIGLFRRDLNWEYDAFVKRAAYILSRWIVKL